MKVLFAGSSGFIGGELIPVLRERGHEVVRLVRSEKKMLDDTLLWDPEHRELDLEDFEGFDVVINLAGENIASGRWTQEKKKKIRESRVFGTHMLSELFARVKTPPKLFLNASATGYYGDRGEEVLDEGSPSGKGFLADVCKQWEEATLPAKEKGIRVVNLRFGVVFFPTGGALAKMLTPFKLGLGGVIGTGKQYISWISMDDLIGVVLHVIGEGSLRGPVNVVTPHPVTNRELTKKLGKVLKRPTILPMPAFAARLIMGEMAEETVLSSTRVLPKVLVQSGYSFLFPKLESALRHMLEK